MTPEELSNIANELKRLGGELNLSDNQKEQLRTFLTDKYEQLQEYRKNNPNIPGIGAFWIGGSSRNRKQGSDVASPH